MLQRLRAISRSRVAWLVAFGAVATAALFWLRAPERTAAMRGRDVATRYGCFACHGPEGSGGVADPSAGNVPGWVHADTYVRDDDELRTWIREGRPRDDHGHAGLIPMPAYPQLKGRDLDDLCAYYYAVAGRSDSHMPEVAYDGLLVARQLGCFGCHGPSGMGGVPNPGSFKGHIPAWDGHEYTDLVRSEDELREWILDGHCTRLWSNPVARHFLERQTIQMPAYRHHISDDQLKKIVAYLAWMRK